MWGPVRKRYLITFLFYFRVLINRAEIDPPFWIYVYRTLGLARRIKVWGNFGRKFPSACKEFWNARLKFHTRKRRDTLKDAIFQLASTVCKAWHWSLNIHSESVNIKWFDQSEHDTRIWHHVSPVSKECPQALYQPPPSPTPPQPSAAVHSNKNLHCCNSKQFQ